MPLSSTPAARAITNSAWSRYASDFYMIESKPEDLTGDRAFDSDLVKRFDVENESRRAYVIVDCRTSDPIAQLRLNS